MDTCFTKNNNNFIQQNPTCENQFVMDLDLIHHFFFLTIISSSYSTTNNFYIEFTTFDTNISNDIIDPK